MAQAEEPEMNITKVVCLTTIESIWDYIMAEWLLIILLAYISITGAIRSSMNGK
jgi:hypothetical protein